MLAIGVGGADAVDALTGTPWELKAPQVIGWLYLKYRLRLTERLDRCPSHWTTQWLGDS